MKRIVLIAAIAACRKDAVNVADASVAPPAVAVAPDGAFVLTPEKLDAFLRYLKALTAVMTSTDGGLLDRARQDEAARVAVGLTEDDVSRIDEMMSAVIAGRMVTNLGLEGKMQPNLEALGAQLDDEQRKRLEAATVAFKAQQQAAKDLTNERKRYGSKNIDVLLTREADLTAAWSQAMGMPAPLPAR